jgi:hypothetical protein
VAISAASSDPPQRHELSPDAATIHSSDEAART